MDRLAEAVQRLGGEVAERRGATAGRVHQPAVALPGRSGVPVPAWKRVIEVRSAARVGYSDLGVNRRRVEDLRTFFTSP